jgi:hypothetical protein
MDILCKPQSEDKVKAKLEAFLAKHQLVLSDIDIVISGLCGDTKRDAIPHALNENYFTAQTILGYKHLSGEYMTSSAFAFWLACRIAQTSAISAETVIRDTHRPASRILIYNVYKNDHAFILINK